MLQGVRLVVSVNLAIELLIFGSYVFVTQLLLFKCFFEGSALLFAALELILKCGEVDILHELRLLLQVFPFE